jgi:hypothetical protein
MIKQIYKLECDKCKHEEKVTFESCDDALNYTVKMGWNCAWSDGKWLDLCPKCKGN